MGGACGARWNRGLSRTAKTWLGSIAAKKLPEFLPCLVQTWNFGDDLAMIFLPGEAVVDYALRFKQEYDPERLWITRLRQRRPMLHSIQTNSP